MLISKKHKVIFVHINKTGGTSLNQLLCGRGNHGRETIKFNMHHHAPAWMIKEKLDEEHPNMWDEYEKISMVRNPYSWQVSMYEFIKAESWHGDSRLIRKMTFKEYLEYFIGDGQLLPINNGRRKDDLNPFYMSQSKYIYNDDNNLMVDTVMKLESFQDDFNTLCEKIPSIGCKDVLHVNKTKHDDYKTYYEDTTIKKMVQEIFQDDFKNFNYSTDL